MIGIGWIGPIGRFLLCIFFYVALISPLIPLEENELRNGYREQNTDYQKKQSNSFLSFTHICSQES
jgi:hypothetical protein